MPYTHKETINVGFGSSSEVDFSEADTVFRVFIITFIGCVIVMLVYEMHRCNKEHRFGGWG